LTIGYFLDKKKNFTILYVFYSSHLFFFVQIWNSFIFYQIFTHDFSIFIRNIDLINKKLISNFIVLCWIKTIETLFDKDFHTVFDTNQYKVFVCVYVQIFIERIKIFPFTNHRSRKIQNHKSYKLKFKKPMKNT
jgi:hypothetical protein